MYAKNKEFKENKIKYSKLNIAKKKIFNFLQPYILLKLANKLKSNKNRLIYIISGSYKHIDYEKYLNLENIYFLTLSDKALGNLIQP